MGKMFRENSEKIRIFWFAKNSHFFAKLSHIFFLYEIPLILPNFDKFILGKNAKFPEKVFEILKNIYTKCYIFFRESFRSLETIIDLDTR